MAPRALDHLVVACRDLARAAADWERLGFTLTPRAYHPFGTTNRLIQFGATFVELIALHDERLIRPPTDRTFSFGDFNRRILADREGGSLLVVVSADADADLADYAARGLRTFDRFDFERTARQPDGAERTVAFRLAVVADPALPEVGTFACENRFPQNFWTPAFQEHANGATDIAEIVVVADNPSDHHVFFAAFTGERDFLATSAGLVIPTPNGAIRLVTPAAFAALYGIDPGPVPTPRIAGWVCAVAAIDETNTVLSTNGVPFAERGPLTVVDAAHAAGIVTMFTPEDRR